MTELSRFCALCDEHGVTYGQGVAMGLKLPDWCSTGSSMKGTG